MAGQDVGDSTVPRPTRRHRKTREDKNQVDAARALGISIKYAKRIVRTGNGPAYSRIVLAKALGLTNDELLYGTREAAHRAGVGFQGYRAIAGEAVAASHPPKRVRPPTPCKSAIFCDILREPYS